MAHTLADRLEDLWPAEPGRADRLCRSIPRGPADRLTVIAADGAVLGDSIAEVSRMPNHRTPDRPEVLAALDGRIEVESEPGKGTEFRVILPV